MIFKSDGSESDLDGFLDSGSHLDGELRFRSHFRIDGKVTGRIVSQGGLVVGERGEVDGEISVGKVLVSGTVHGTIQAAEQVAIVPGGKVFGDIETPSLIIQDGGQFEGRCSMSRKQKAPAPVTQLRNKGG